MRQSLCKSFQRDISQNWSLGLKNNFKYKEFNNEKFLVALRQAVLSSENLFNRAAQMDSKVSKDVCAYNDILEIIDSFQDKKSDYGKVEGKYTILPYGRVCFNLSTTKTSVVFEVCLASALTYNSALVYSYSMENYAVNMYLITLINETLKRFLAINYIMFQIGEAPKVKNVFYIDYDSQVEFYPKKNSAPEAFGMDCLLIKSRI